MRRLGGTSPRVLARASLAVALAACRGGASGPAAQGADAERLAEAVRPEALARALKSLGGVHVTAKTTFDVRAADGATPAAPITTTTDLVIDGTGQWKLTEENDRDGGRTAYLVGRELFVGLRYDRLVRRPAQEPEPTRLVEQAVGGPFAAWEVVAHAVAVEPGQDAAGSLEALLASKRRTLRLKKAGGAPAAGAVGSDGLRAWRATLEVESLEGEVTLLERAGTPPPPPVIVAFRLESRWKAVRDGRAVMGHTAVSLSTDDIGRVAAIEAPADALALRTRQRTVLEERALLGPGDGARRAGYGAKTTPP